MWGDRFGLGCQLRAIDGAGGRYKQEIRGPIQTLELRTINRFGSISREGECFEV